MDFLRTTSTSYSKLFTRKFASTNSFRINGTFKNKTNLLFHISKILSFNVPTQTLFKKPWGKIELRELLDIEIIEKYIVTVIVMGIATTTLCVTS